MNAEDKRIRAAKAREILGSEVFAEAVAELEKDAYSRLLSLGSDQHEARWAIVCEINAVRAVKDRLAMFVHAGKQASKEPIQIA